MSRPLRSRLSPLRPSGALFWAAALVVFAGLVVPLIHANRFQRQIRAALEGSLGRKVEIGEVTLTLLSGPGFELQNVIIGEDPAFGIEHFAYMDSMQARLRLRTLWTGQIQLASLTMIDPSINLVKNSQGRWNFEALLGRAGGHGSPDGPAARSGVTDSAPTYFPYIGIRGGRVNFKFGDYKSVFCFEDLDAALSPERDERGRWRVRFTGLPARTDRILSGMGVVRGEGEWGTAASQVRLDLSLAQSPLEHLLTLFYGRDFGMHGETSARVQMSGPISGAQIQGVLLAGDIHRWDLSPSEDSRFSVPFSGKWNLPGQQLDVETGSPAAMPVRARLSVENYLAAPAWRMAVAFDHAPAKPFLLMARHLGVAVPAGMDLSGWLNGGLEFAGSLWPHGSLRLEDGSLLLSAAPPVRVKAAEARLDGPAFEIPPAEIRAGEEVFTASVRGRLDPFRIDARLSADGLQVRTVRQHLQSLKPGWSHSLASGLWKGQLAYHKQTGEPGSWSGSGVLTGAVWQPGGLESPIELARARVRWDSAMLRVDGLEGSLGETQFTGNCNRRLAGSPPQDAGAESGNQATQPPQDYCQIHVAGLDLGELDRWLNPQQKVSRWEIWRRALGGSGPTAPSWLRAARIQGEVTVEDLHLGNWSFHNVRSDLAWSGQALALNRLRAELGRGMITGSMRVEFTGEDPRYRLQASARGLELRSLSGWAALPANFQRGTLDLSLSLDTAGRTAPALAEALKASGAFSGRSIVLDNIQWKDAAPDADTIEIRSLDGRFEWTRSGFDLSGLSMTVGRETYQGRGSIGGRPALLFDVASRGKTSRVVASGAAAVAADTP